MSDAIVHSSAFRTRRFLNWFPMGVTYALLYMGRYNLTVAKTSLDKMDLMTKEDFGIIFFVGTLVYALSFLVNGPLIDRIGGRLGILIAAGGSGIVNLLMGWYLTTVLDATDPTQEPLRLVFSLLYGVNMYFQSFGAVSIVKVNAHWFHVRERGGFSGIFGTMISSGIFLAFTVNGWILDLLAVRYPGERMQWVVFSVPGALLLIFLVVEFFLLRDTPGKAGHEDFDTGDASSGNEGDEPEGVLALYKRILTNPLILIIAGVEFCTGVLRNGVMHWFPFYAKEVWALSGDHGLVYGQWDPAIAFGLFAVAIVSAVLAKLAKGPRRAYLIISAGIAFLAPFTMAGWGGLLFVAGVVGGNVAGWVSDLFFQSRRAPSAGGLYFILATCCVGMLTALSLPTNEVSWAKEGSGLLVGDRILELAGQPTGGWDDVRKIAACYEPTCKGGAKWDEALCICTTNAGLTRTSEARPSPGTIPAVVERDGARLDVTLTDPFPAQKAGEKRLLLARPVLPLSPWVLGVLVFLISLCVIGTHGLLSGTATMDFGGRKGAATAVGVIDGAVYAGTALQSIALGYLTTASWTYWPIFLAPFALGGFLLLRFTRLWNAKPKGRGGH
jgi:MFS transporter, OPA family, glycerol-3-phosphate transporter